MKDKVLDMFAVGSLPHPWPSPVSSLLLRGEGKGLIFEVIALSDGRLLLLSPSHPSYSFLSQPIEIQADKPSYSIFRMTLKKNESALEIAGQPLLKYESGVETRVIVANDELVPQAFSVTDPDIATKCETWIQNRKAMFSTPATPRDNRRSKTVNEQAQDLVASINRLRHLQQLIQAGAGHLLGTLAGELRASIYWPPNISGRLRQWNPLLFRMANLGELPLPVFSLPHVPKPKIPNQIAHYELANYPRVEKMFKSDQVCDLQEALLNTVVQIGDTPEKQISALDLIKELAHTMGSSHYDEDASEFLDLLKNMHSPYGDQVTIFMCRTAESVASLSEWVLGSLTREKIIG